LHPADSTLKIEAVNWLPAHRSHDFPYLIGRWRRVAREARVEVRQFAEAEGLPVLAVESRAALKGEPLIYLSAGVHGDESAPVCGLLSWAEENIELLRKKAFLILPCVNPYGLIRNVRVDHRGMDINRRFHLVDDEICGPWHRMVNARAMVAGLCLHEDYDAEGTYLYELSGSREVMGHDLLAACAGAIKPDGRKKIEGRAAVKGVIRRKRFPKDLPGMPEAVVLHQLGCPLTLTFETPSEFSLDARIAAQRLFVEAAVAKVLSADV
jgi:hypothetical protein